jgi:hypothetical protein
MGDTTTTADTGKSWWHRFPAVKLFHSFDKCNSQRISPRTKCETSWTKKKVESHLSKILHGLVVYGTMNLTFCSKIRYFWWCFRCDIHSGRDSTGQHCRMYRGNSVVADLISFFGISLTDQYQRRWKRLAWRTFSVPLLYPWCQNNLPIFEDFLLSCRRRSLLRHMCPGWLIFPPVTVQHWDKDASMMR